MNQQDYYEIGESKRLPLRCPILNYCSRRAVTIYFNSDYYKSNSDLTVEEALIKDGTLPQDFESKKIQIQGEPPSWIKGSCNYHFDGMCPEVNLFDNMNSLFKGVACISAEYDKYYPAPKHRVLKTQHYSKCSEFNWYMFERGRLKISNTKPRKTISAKTRSILQKEIKSICPICSNEDVEHFQVHHIDENPTNNDVENLLMLCPICHSKITKGDISYSEVKNIKKELNKTK
ncbi:HNH endonuclease [Chryseobacterium taeanense]|uniref:HNH endonuclease n=1 Tax=Chryseobacterium taeanense TaxID=311334 RepID=A0A1G8KER8_9FLAO|nr:HNH endonuclease signature motif containing protein [Chryseobacterium taeanense]SDI41933.1 HNH endonuclease [Chryseobacterium taeanense]